MALSVAEIFSSFQGEGIKTGLPTTFVRMAGCNLRCDWCDTPYSLDHGSGEEMEVDEILGEVEMMGNDLICITGGEPLIQDGIIELIGQLMDRGFEIDIETNGTILVDEVIKNAPGSFLSMDVKTPSSGEAGSFDVRNIPLLRDTDQLKFIVKDRADLEFAIDFLKLHLPGCSIIITPCSNEFGSRLAGWIDEYLKILRKGNEEIRRMAGRIRLMLQTHRVIWGDRKGV